MSFSIRRTSRVLIASVLGTAVGLYALRKPLDEPRPEEVGVTEVSFDPAMSDLRLRITLNGKRGYVDGSGQMVIQPTFALAMPFSEGMAAVANRAAEDGRPQWQFVNAAGMVVFPQVFKGGQIGTFHEGLAPIAVDGKWGFINLTGQFAVQPAYDGADDFSEGFAAVRTGRKYGVIARDGTVILHPTYDFIGNYKGGLAIFAQNERFGYLDQQGQVAIPATYDSAADFSEGLAFVAQKSAGRSLGGYINAAGRFVIDPKPIDGGPFKQGLAAIHSENEAYFINPAGETVLKAERARKVGNFSEDLAPALIDGAYGFIDRTGRVAIAPQWQSVGDFNRGVCRVNSGGVRGYINKQGKYIWKLEL